jgi:prepilin-type processing-associated H-X9-DG protein
LNGNGVTCASDPKADGTPSDRALFKDLGLFFLENWRGELTGGTMRHYTLEDVRDGLSQTFLASENVRTGYDPESASSTFASSNPYLCAFYIGDPCRAGGCKPGNVDYAACNSNAARINSGLTRPEGTSPVPNSWHAGGVNVAYADGHVKFVFETIDGRVYAALASPQGVALRGTPLEQTAVAGDD